MRAPTILVFGSLNIDLVQSVPRLPAPGETLRGGDFAIHVGGKGANQACAAGKLSGRTALAGMVGDDAFGSRLLHEVSNHGVDVQRVRRAKSPTGTAIILVTPDGDNVIVIAAGANGAVSEDAALEATAMLSSGDVLLCQLEVPLAAVEAALCAAHQQGVTTILDPAPACELSDRLLQCVSILTPNQTEAALLCGRDGPVRSPAEAADAARQLRARGVETVVIKMGEAGCLVLDSHGSEQIPGHAVRAVDTTAAGDTFNGALAVALTEGKVMREALRFANAAAALSVQKAGAIASIPSRSEVDQLVAVAAPGGTFVSRS